MISSDQIRAARALLNWSQGDLADRTGLATPSIGNMEIGKHNPSLKSQQKIITAFDEAGVEFIDDGVRKKQDLVRVIEGDDCYLRMLDDVYHTLRNKDNAELLIAFADDRVSPPEVNESYRRIRKSGATMRQLVKEGNTYLLGGLDEYRAIPKGYFLNRVFVIYDQKVAFVLSSEEKITIFSDPIVSDVMRNVFDILFSVLDKPEGSTADERF